MEFTTHDLSKILNVSTNTVRRFEEKGYLSSDRNEKNSYRKFDHTDVEKLMYINKYRRIGFSHDKIQEIFQEDIGGIAEIYREKMMEIERQIAHFTSLRHLLKDDIGLMDRIREYGSEIFEFQCPDMQYVLYNHRGKLRTDGENGEMLHYFMSECPEFEYIYHFSREDVETGVSAYSEGVMANQQVADKHGLRQGPPMVHYESHLCVMRFIRLPFDFTDDNRIAKSELQKILIGDFMEYMEEHGYVLAGDVLGLKIGFSREDGEEWQHVLMHFPVERNFMGGGI